VEGRGPAIAPRYEPSFPPEPEPVQRGTVAKLSLWWRHRAFLWRVFWITTVLSIVVAFLLPVHYKSTAKLVVPDNQANAAFSGMISRAAGPGSSALGIDPTSLLGLKTPGAFYAAVLQSRTVQDHLVEKFDLRAHYKKRYYQDARKQLGTNTEIVEEKKTGVITLSVTDWDKEFAAMLVHGYIEEMNRMALDLNVSAAHLEREFLEARLKTAGQDLDQAAFRLSEFSSKHTMMDVQQQSKAIMDTFAKLQGELIGTESELKGLEQIYSADNVRVRTLKARVAELQAQLKRMVGNYTSPNEVSDAKSNDYPSIRTLPALGYRYQDLYRQAKTQETIFDFLAQQYELARVEEAKELPVFRVMDKPNVPEKKESPTRSLVVGLSVFVAMVLACWWVVEKEKWDRLPADDSRRQLLAAIRSDLRRVMQRFRRV
jgi:uncharacterized protein involved in exopolysaccharide biosynthesis